MLDFTCDNINLEIKIQMIVNINTNISAHIITKLILMDLSDSLIANIDFSSFLEFGGVAGFTYFGTSSDIVSNINIQTI